jgi:hypothetical protein
VLAPVLHIEGAEAIDPSFELLDVLYIKRSSVSLFPGLRSGCSFLAKRRYAFRMSSGAAVRATPRISYGSFTAPPLRPMSMTVA